MNNNNINKEYPKIEPIPGVNLNNQKDQDQKEFSMQKKYFVVIVKFLHYL